MCTVSIISSIMPLCNRQMQTFKQSRIFFFGNGRITTSIMLTDVYDVPDFLKRVITGDEPYGL